MSEELAYEHSAFQRLDHCGQKCRCICGTKTRESLRESALECQVDSKRFTLADYRLPLESRVSFSAATML